MDYRDQVVIVTGASSGIGYVTACAFARRGARVVGVARRENRLQALMRECRRTSPDSFYLCGDLGERPFAESVIHASAARLGRLDLLINNAAISQHKQIYHLSAEEAERVMRINFLSCVWTTLSAIPYLLRQHGGTIVNVSSFAAHVSPPREAIYAASKAALSRFSEGLVNDLAGSNIHVALIHPGPIDTEIWTKQDEPSGFVGKKYPPELVSHAIFRAIERRLHEVEVPRFDARLILARWLRRRFPGLLRRGMAWSEPVPAEVVEQARSEAKRPRP